MKKKVSHQDRGRKAVKDQQEKSRDSFAIAGFAAALLAFASFGAHGQAICALRTSSDAVGTEVDMALAEFGTRLVAVGRVDAVTRSGRVDILGRIVQSIAGEALQIGDYAAVVDWSRAGSQTQLLEARLLQSRYVPGASEVYLRSKVSVADTVRGRARLGSVYVDYSATALALRPSRGLGDSVMAVRGTQPHPGGVIIGDCAAASLETLVSGRKGRPVGSLGTGRPEGSLGTGRPDGSLGTGSPDGSLGTGRPDGSLGTGRPDGSLGTGSPDGSLGTGRPDG
ncbi:MAG TPA: hypothetical protein VH856_00580, partial [Steroidobacteraceae bacterium]